MYRVQIGGKDVEIAKPQALAALVKAGLIKAETMAVDAASGKPVMVAAIIAAIPQEKVPVPAEAPKPTIDFDVSSLLAAPAEPPAVDEDIKDALSGPLFLWAFLFLLGLSRLAAGIAFLSGLILLAEFAVAIASIVWVGRDARKQKLHLLRTSRLPHLSMIDQQSPAEWLAVCIVLWPIAFPAYLLKRRKLIRAALFEEQRLQFRKHKLTTMEPPADTAPATESGPPQK